MQNQTWKLGIELAADDQKQVLAAFVHRYTGDHRPNWAYKNDFLQFADDQDWLAHTRFRVKRDGRLDSRVKFCQSNPTWPNGPKGLNGPLNTNIDMHAEASPCK